MSDRSRGAGFMTGVVLGSLLGATVAILATTKKGQEIREELAEKLEPAKEKGLEVFQVVKEQAGQVLSKIQSDADSTSHDSVHWMELPTQKSTSTEQGYIDIKVETKKTNL